MRKLLFFLFAIFGSGIILAQSGSKWDVNMKVEEQQQAHYPKGDQEFYQYVYSHLSYPQCVQGKTIGGEVSISFDVMPDSTLSNFVILKDVDCNIGNSIVQVLKTMKFAPSIQNGVKVKENMVYNFPIRISN